MLHTTDYKHFVVRYPDGRTVEFEGGLSARPAFPGDTVQMDGKAVAAVLKRVKHGPFVGTLELASKMRFGMTSRNVPIYRFTPFNECYPPFFVGCSHPDTSKNLLAYVEFLNWDSGTCPRGNLLRILGPCGSLEAEEAALLLDACPFTWKKKDTEEIRVPPPCEAEYDTHGFTFHIDPPGCRDIDDAVTLSYTGGDLVGVKIHIADVASWLVANPELKAKAAAQGQTYYRDGVAVKPMFPATLSEGLFSLLPGENRCTLTLTFYWNKVTKAITGISWSAEKVVVRGSYTYETFYESPYRALIQSITSSLAGKPLTDSHDWVEQLMLFYNKEVARILRVLGAGILRRHAGKDVERYDRFEAIGLPAEKLAMRAGEYCSAVATDTVHWGLGADVYCHASSPIRRWADCVNQMVLRDSILYGKTPRDNHSIPRSLFRASTLDIDIATTAGSDTMIYSTPESIDILNRNSAKAKRFERDMTFVRLLLAPAAPVEGSVAEVTEAKTKLWIPTWNRMVTARTMAQGFVPGDRVTVTYYSDPTQRSWKKRIVFAFTKN